MRVSFEFPLGFHLGFDLLKGFFRLRVSLEFHLGFRVPLSRCLIGFRNVHVDFFGAYLGFHLGFHAGFQGFI